MGIRTRPARGVVVLLAGALLAIACSEGGGEAAPTTTATVPVTEPPAPTTTKPPPPSSSSQLADLEGLVKIAMDASGAPGALVGVWAPGHRAFVRGFGVADTATGAPITPDQSFRLGTATKAVTCSVVLQLVDELLVGLDDPIGEYVANVPNPGATLRQLCQGTSGMPDYATPAFAEAVAAGPTRTWSTSQLFSYAGSQPAFPPGQGWYDSNTAIQLLGVVIEEVTQRSVEENIRTRVIERLDLPTVHYPSPGEVELPAPALHGYWSPPPGDALVDYTALSPSVGGPAGALVADLEGARELVTQLAIGNLVNDASHAAQLQTIAIPDGPPWMGYGLGVLVMGPLVGHDGIIPGYASAMFHHPATGTTFVVVLTTSNAGSGPALALVANLAALVTPAQVPWGLGEVTGRYGNNLG